ncbi:MAG: hypothetical protein MJZ68_09310 [archaeon]|nr:hypothetical protein [archaeon]
MVRRYTVSRVSTVSEASRSSYPRNVSLEVDGHRLRNISRCTGNSIDYNTVGRVGDGNIIDERYVEINLDDLRRLEADRNALGSFVRARTGNMDLDSVTVLIVKLCIGEGQSLCDGDYDALNRLLAWKCNDIYVMPFLDFNGVDRTVHMDIYDRFVKEMLERRSSWVPDGVNIGMSVPQAYPRSRIDRLMELYSDEKPSFVAVDLNNTRLDRPGDTVGPVFDHFREEGDERFFMYGVNARPYERGVMVSPAWDVYLVHASFNAFGPMHRKPRVPLAGSDWTGMGRIFDPRDLTYRALGETTREAFLGWATEGYGHSLEWEYDQGAIGLYPYLKRYDFHMVNKVLTEFSKAIDDDDLDYIRWARDLMPERMKNADLSDRSWMDRP